MLMPRTAEETRHSQWQDSMAGQNFFQCCCSMVSIRYTHAVTCKKTLYCIVVLHAKANFYHIIYY